MNVNINIGPESTEALAARDRIVLVRTRSQFDALECQWKSLFERAGRAPHLFQSYDWLWHWANNYLSAGTSVCLVTGWHGPRLTMVWPLVEVRAGFSKLCWMGQPVSP